MQGLVHILHTLVWLLLLFVNGKQSIKLFKIETIKYLRKGLIYGFIYGALVGTVIGPFAAVLGV